MEQIGNTLRVLRTVEGLSQRRVARKLEGSISDQTISNWEQGKVEPEEGNLRQLLKVFGLSLAEFQVLNEVMEADGEDAMLERYNELKQKKAGGNAVKVLTTSNAVRILQWVASMNDAARSEIMGQLSDEDARMLVWIMSEKIKPLPVIVKKQTQSGKSGKEKGTHADAPH